MIPMNSLSDVGALLNGQWAKLCILPRTHILAFIVASGSTFRTAVEHNRGSLGNIVPLSSMSLADGRLSLPSVAKPRISSMMAFRPFSVDRSAFDGALLRSNWPKMLYSDSPNSSKLYRASFYFDSGPEWSPWVAYSVTFANK